MILQALAGYYRRLEDEGDSGIAPEGFERKEIPFIIEIDKLGKFKNLRDTREGEGKVKRGRLFTIPQGVKKTSGIAANLLWDTPNYVIGCPKIKADKNPEQQRALAKEQHIQFVGVIQEKFPFSYRDEGIQAVLAYLENGDFADLFQHPIWKEVEEKSANVTFKLDADDCLICQRTAVVARISGSNDQNTSNDKQICLVTGEKSNPVRLHTAIKGVRNAQSSGANIVSFNLDAFTSYGKEQGANAPIGRSGEFAYTTALNHLLSRDSRQKIQVGEATTVFWTEKTHPFEGAFYALFRSDSSKGDEEQDYKSLLSLFRSPEKGVKTSLPRDTKFYVLGLSPNAARIAVRFWYVGTVGSVADNIWQHFDDLEMIKGTKEWHSISLRWLLRSTALQGKDDNVPPNLAGDTIKSILSGIPYPRTLLASVIRRCRAEQDVTYTRAALIKAILVREARYYQQIYKEVSMSLDISNNNPGYLLGRLFAALEHAQEIANPGLNTTIRDRFYGAASGTPATAFPQLMKLKNHHIAKMENKGQSVNMERLIGEIIGKVTASEGFPNHLSLQDQGRFAVGYYHQRQDFYTKKEKDIKLETKTEEVK